MSEYIVRKIKVWWKSKMCPLFYGNDRFFANPILCNDELLHVSQLWDHWHRVGSLKLYWAGGSALKGSSGYLTDRAWLHGLFFVFLGWISVTYNIIFVCDDVWKWLFYIYIYTYIYVCIFIYHFGDFSFSVHLYLRKHVKLILSYKFLSIYIY